jgi:hypothetical protein
VLVMKFKDLIDVLRGAFGNDWNHG